MSQDKFPLFSAKVGERIRWLRQRRGLSQGELADGSASTASSWEKDGKMPRQDKWEGISERLRLSWSLVSTGTPATSADYDFIRENRSVIDFADAPQGLKNIEATPAPEEEETSLHEDQSPYGTPASLRREIEQRHRDLLAEAGDDVARLGWISVQQQSHLTPPAEWRKAKAKGVVIVRAPAHHQNPTQPSSGRASGGAASAA